VKKTSRVFLCVALILGATTVAFGQSSKPLLKMAMFSSPGGIFHPAFATDSYDFYVTRLVFQTLLQWGEDGQLDAFLAEKWTVSPDGTVFTFTLRPGLKWQDGHPLTAEDVKYSIEYVGHPDYKGARGSFIAAIKGVEDFKQGKTPDLAGIKVVDARTVQITTAKTYSSGLLRFGKNFEIFPKHIWDKVPVGKALEATEMLRNPIGSGPFKLVNFVPDQYVEFVRNDDYWGGKPKLERFILQKTNQNVAQAMLLKGEIDQINLTTLTKKDEELYKSRGMMVKSLAYNAYQYMAFNHTMDVFKDKRVRQAFAHAMDRESVVNVFMEGKGSVANNPYPPTFWAHPSGLKEYKYNPKEAIALLKAAGWEYRDSEKKMYRDGKPVKFVLKYSKGNVITEKSAPLLQQNLKDIGIELELQIMEFAPMFDQVKRGDFELAFVGQGNEMDGDLSKFYYSAYIKPLGDNSGSDFIRYKNPELDKLIDSSMTTLDQKKRTEIYHKIALLLNDELPVVYRYHWYETIVYDGKLNHLFSPYAGEYYIKMQDWFFRK